MKKLILSCLFLMCFFSSYSQYRTIRQNGVLARTEEFESNSPGNMIANSILLAYYKDHTAMGFAYPSIEFWNFTSSRNDGIPTSIAWFDTNGFLKRSPLPTEADPVWIAEKGGYYNKTEADGRYLQSFTESDPTVGSHIKTITVGNINDWQAKQAALVSGTNIKTLEGQSVLGSGNIDLSKTDIGLGNVDNTTDLNKPISTLTQTALNGKLSSEIDGSLTNELQTLSISGNVLSISTGNNITLPNLLYDNTASVAGGAGNVIFYLTSDKTSTGTALYSSVTYINPVVNDASLNYTYGWSYNAGTKALTVNVKSAVGVNVALLGLTLLGAPANVTNGTSVNILVKGI